MESRNKKFTISALAAAIIAGIFLYFGIGKVYAPDFSQEAVSNAKPEKSAEIQSKSQPDTVGWETIQSTDGKFEFRYPADKLEISKIKSNITLSHSVPFDHEDPCDLRDGSKRLKNLTDFEVTFQFLNMDLKSAVVSSEPDFFRQDYLVGDKISVTPGYIDEINLGKYSGYRITNSVEGCGEHVYYLILDPQNTLRVSRLIIAEFQPFLTNYQENLKVPGIIEPVQEEKIFTGILESLALSKGENPK